MIGAEGKRADAGGRAPTGTSKDGGGADYEHPLGVFPGRGGVLGADVLTGKAEKKPKIVLRRPILSGPHDLSILVRNSKTQVKGRFQRGRRLARFESHLPEGRTARANTLVRNLQALKISICRPQTVPREARMPARPKWVKAD